MSFKNKLRTYFDGIANEPIKHDGEFCERLKNRHKIFWKTSNAEKVRNTITSSNEPMEKWKNVNNWQRKLSNKYNSKEFAKKHNCKIAHTYWKGRNLNTLKFDNLPESYVIRPTIGHGSSMVFLMVNSVNLMNGKTFSKEDLKKVLATALDENNKLEFLFEEFLRSESGVYKIPDDYKLYTFNGHIACIEVINRLGLSKGFTTCYNEDWQMLENVNSYYLKGEYQQSPKCLQEMLVKAKELSRSYELFVRIDFYATDKGAVFGEFTPTPALGHGFTPDAEDLFTRYWDEFCNGMI